MNPPVRIAALTFLLAGASLAGCKGSEGPGSTSIPLDAARDQVAVPDLPADAHSTDLAVPAGPDGGGPSDAALGPDAAVTATDGALAVDQAAVGGSCVSGPGHSVTLSPKLFSKGQDPSGDPECTQVLNPERGIFVFRDLRHLEREDLRGLGVTLIYGQVLIPEYRNRDLDKALFDQLTAGFALLRAAGVKALPRIYYADGMMADAPLDRVLAHIHQLAPLLQANADVIAVLHPGFVGAWGEWHSSTNKLTEPAARKQIYDALLAVLPADRMTLTRRPAYKRDAYGGPLTAETAFTGKPLARIGHLNDCFLASADDEGTYVVPGERDYAVADSEFVPVGGETCAPAPVRSECPSALDELAALHWDFINIDYHPDVLAGWMKGGCYPTIRCRLGYRLLSLGHSTPERVKRGAPLSVALDLINDGYGRVYNPRPVYLVLTGPQQQRQVLRTDFDPRRLGPGQTASLCLSALVPAGTPPGVYQLGLWMPDDAATLKANPQYAVRVSNLDWDAVTGTNLFGASVTVE
jgi:hypothetical protein